MLVWLPTDITTVTILNSVPDKMRIDILIYLYIYISISADFSQIYMHNMILEKLVGFVKLK